MKIRTQKYSRFTYPNDGSGFYDILDRFPILDIVHQNDKAAFIK